MNLACSVKSSDLSSIVQQSLLFEAVRVSRISLETFRDVRVDQTERHELVPLGKKPAKTSCQKRAH